VGDRRARDRAFQPDPNKIGRGTPVALEVIRCRVAAAGLARTNRNTGRDRL